jgi:hypothetical protein
MLSRSPKKLGANPCPYVAINCGTNSNRELTRATIPHRIIRRSGRQAFMREEAAITINGARLADAESMTVRVAIDTFANVLAEGLGLTDDGIALTDRYMESLSRIQNLLENRESRKQ